MTNNEPEFEKPGAIPVQLCFFYDPPARKIPFSSSSADSFFETILDLRQDPPFLKAFEEMGTDFLITEWGYCLQLKENEKRNFTIAISKPKKQLNFSFTVMKPAYSLITDSSLLIISVTRVLTNSISQQQSKTLSSFNKEYAEFIELAAHDLDSPLRKLSMLVERITSKYESTTDIDAQGYVLRARACLSDMRTLIENLSLLGRLSASSGERIPCNLNNIIQMALKDLEGLPGEKNVKILTGSLPVVQGDNAQYKQLFRSLLENCFKFKKNEMPAEVEIMGEAATDNEKQVNGLPFINSYYKITIADKGIGFRQEYAEKIFQAFVRLNGKSEYPGSGIGLALCKKIVENHGGIIYAEGDENVGARFILFLPLSPD